MFLRLLLVTLSVSTARPSKLQKHFEWNILDFQYENTQQKLNDLATGKLKPENALPVGIEIWNDKVFVTVPRWKEGKYENNHQNFLYLKLKIGFLVKVTFEFMRYLAEITYLCYQSHLI